MGLAKHLILAVVSLAPAAFAQMPASGSIRGQVLDQSGAAVPGADIELTNTDTGLHRQTVSDVAGHYTLPELPLTGRYRIRFSKAGFAAQERDGLRLRSGESAYVNVVLS